jgi:hypothetical protein
MDIHLVLAAVVEEVLDSVEAANGELGALASVDYPSRVEIEFGMTTSYEVANYDDVSPVKVRVSFPFYKGKKVVSPAIAAEAAALEKEATKKGTGKK